MSKGIISNPISFGNPTQSTAHKMNMPLPYCVYVLYSLKDHKRYIGFTTNLQRRVMQHNKGLNTSTRPRLPLKLMYCEFYPSRADAMRREGYFKTTAGRRALSLMLRSTSASHK